MFWDMYSLTAHAAYTVCRMTHIEDKERLKLFLMKLANATYDTFGEVPDDFADKIKPSEYMDLVLAVRTKSTGMGGKGGESGEGRGPR